ncbi:zinc finger MYM-type protein 1-like [Capsicum annuum]|uniref:zinc finger MYM-type protein 1-like n=1 Tax=Capsicum annuum TaxID=4072 RepID=UPI001FB1198F|nr:zinc finger MYM-type protein 1-like [Capsicum annuum]
MALVLRYVDKKGEVVEQFIGLVHVSDTSACSLKKEIYSLLSDHSLSPSKIRGQGYDGASNMKGEINDLKTLIMKDSPSAYYINYFAHQLQLTRVAIAKKYVEVEDFFYHVTNMLNVVGGYFKRRDLLRHYQTKNLKQLLESGEAHIGQGLNQECGLQRPVIDVQLQELNERFAVVSSDLLLGMGSLNPVNSFSNFDKGRIMTLAKCYLNEFNDGKLRALSYQLDTFIIHM